MGSRTRRLFPGVAASAVVAGGLATLALAAGPGGWDHLGDRGTPGSVSLDDVASALEVTPGALYVGGGFENAGGIPEADRIATWNGSSWNAVSSTSQISNGRVMDIAVSGDKVYAGGNFQDAGGHPNADNLAVWDGSSWEPFCGPVDETGPTFFDGNVTSLQIIGENLYVGGTFHDGAEIPSADYLLACPLGAGVPSATVTTEDRAFSGPVLALAADGDGTLYAGGRFLDLEDDPAADNVASLPAVGIWEPMGTGGGPCRCAVTDFVRALTTIGTDVYVGTDANDVAGIPEADHVAKWDGTEWSALGAGTSGTNGWFSTTTSINALTSFRSNLFATGLFQNANGDDRADNVAFFDGTAWHPVGSNGGGDGPWNGTGLALAVVDMELYAAGSFTSAGGDAQARSAASFNLAQIIAVPTPTVTATASPGPTPTVTAGPGPVATPTVTPGPAPVPTPTVTPSPTPDTTPPATSLRGAKISHVARKATFRFASGESGSRFLCKLDKRKFKPCSSPKTYKKLKPGKHVFRVKARDAAGLVDATPKVKRFRIRKR